jgi:hypothetical protein
VGKRVDVGDEPYSKYKGGNFAHKEQLKEIEEWCHILCSISTGEEEDMRNASSF